MKPDIASLPEYYRPYVERVPEDNLLDALKTALQGTISLLRGMDEEKGNHRYAEGKWSIKELIGHLIDTERVFCYRAMRYARNDNTELPGFDHDLYVQESRADERTLADLMDEHLVLRTATLTLFKGFGPEQLSRKGVANGLELSVNDLGFIIAGHERHHISVILSKYMD